MPRMHRHRTIRRLAASLLILGLCSRLPAAAAATTTYTGAWSGGTIAAGDTVILAAGATITGTVAANGLLQFNQATALTTSVSRLARTCDSAAGSRQRKVSTIGRSGSSPR